jgi:hypothetical protein
LARLGAPIEEDTMPYTRVAEFEADDEAVDRFVNMVKEDPAPPEGVPATGINILRNRDNGRLRVVVFFDSEEDLRKGSEKLDAMNPPEDLNVRRLSVDTFEVLLQSQAP